MLEKVGSGPSLVVCSTCRLSREERDDAYGKRGGALFAATLRRMLAMHPCSGKLSIEEMPCLFACSTYCSVHLRAKGKIGYVLGKFTPTEDAATALLDYAAYYIESKDGIVDWKNWPEGVKNHFIVRTPPEGMVWAHDDVPST